jgi:hypothetical protein
MQITADSMQIHADFFRTVRQRMSKICVNHHE